MMETPETYLANVATDAETLGRDADALISALTGGAADETVSHRVAVAAQAGRRWACVFCRVLDVAVQRGHCAAVLTPAPLPWWVYPRAGVCFAAAIGGAAWGAWEVARAVVGLP